MKPDTIIEPDWHTMLGSDAEQGIASEIWSATVAEMRSAGTLAIVNQEQIVRYVMWCVVYRRAVAMVAEQGPILVNKRNRLQTHNPWWTVMKDADTLSHRYEESLGLNPRRRGQVTAAKTKKTKTLADDILG